MPRTIIFSVSMALSLCTASVRAAGWTTSAEARAAADAASRRITSLEQQLKDAQKREGDAAVALRLHNFSRPNTSDMERQISQLNGQINALANEKWQAIQSIKAGLFCTACKRTDFELKQQGIDPTGHFQDNSDGGVGKPLTGEALRQAIEDKESQFNQKIQSLQRQVEHLKARIADLWNAYRQQGQVLSDRAHQAEQAVYAIIYQMGQAMLERNSANMAVGPLAAQEDRRAQIERQRAEMEAKRLADEKARKAKEAERMAREKLAEEALKRKREEERLARVAEEQRLLAEQRTREAQEQARQQQRAEAQRLTDEANRAREASDEARAAREQAENERRWLGDQLATRGSAEGAPPSALTSPTSAIPPDLLEQQRAWTDAVAQRQQAERAATELARRQDQTREQLFQVDNTTRTAEQQARDQIESLYDQYQETVRGSPLSLEAHREDDGGGTILEQLGQGLFEGTTSIGDRLDHLAFRFGEATEEIRDRLSEVAESTRQQMREQLRSAPDQLLDEALSYGPSSPAQRVRDTASSVISDLLKSGPDDHPRTRLTDSVVSAVTDHVIDHAEHEIGKTITHRVLGLTSGGTGNRELDRLDDEMVVNSNFVSLAYQTGFTSLSGLKRWMEHEVDLSMQILNAGWREMLFATDDQ